MWKTLRFSEIVGYYTDEKGNKWVEIWYGTQPNGGRHMWHVPTNSVCITNNGIRIEAFAR